MKTFFFEDHLILGTKFNKNSLKVPRCLRNFKNMPQTEKLKKHCLNLLIKDVDFFKQKAETLIKSRHDQSGIFWKDTTSGLKASYEVSQKIVAAKKPHDIGEQLILPCCKDFISNVLGSSEL